MTIFLGLSFADQHQLGSPPAASMDQHLMDPDGLLAWLEQFYALGTPRVNRRALRVEQYRQLLQEHLSRADAVPFYAHSFRADPFATAEELLSRRDELLSAGYLLGVAPEAETPTRIRVLHEVEALLLDDRLALNLMAGPADRLNMLLSVLPEARHPAFELFHHEPRHLLPPGTRRLLGALADAGTSVQPLPEPVTGATDSDLGRWRSLMLGKDAPGPLTGDGSLIILRAQRETHLAAYLARTLRDNNDWRPGVLMPRRNQTLDNALLAEGLPSMGVPTTSLARPTLQVLKLITAFLWEPIEVERIMEFVSLVTKPLDRRLGQRIAYFLADTPGLFGRRWVAMLEGFFTEMKEVRGWSDGRISDVRQQYETWFRRSQYPREERVPKTEIRKLFLTLGNWARENYDDQQPHSGLLVLAAQCQRAIELLDVLPEEGLNYLGVERLVRTVYEPAPLQFEVKEQGSLSVIYSPASAASIPGYEPTEGLIWWDFVETESDYFFSRHYPEELSYLNERGISLNGPGESNELSIWQSLRPLAVAQRQLVLCVPDRVDGSPMEPHPLWGDLEAAFPDGALEKITINVDAGGQATSDRFGLRLPSFAPVPLDLLATPVPVLQLGDDQPIVPREMETPTAVEDLLYYPYKWVFRHRLALKGAPILSIASENRLRGNLSHLFIERLLRQIKADDRSYSREDVGAWINQHAERLLATEGAVLLEYGQEPERIKFIRTIHYAAWSLVDYIQRNGWKVHGSEMKLEGELAPMGGQQITGRADLVLERSKDGKQEFAVVDLKWRGKSVFRNLIRNAKDLQLCLYADFLRTGDTDCVHTAYYIIRDALLMARNELAFTQIETVPAADDFTVVQQQTLTRIRNTFNWRWEQLAEGKVEIRCRETLGFLEDLYLEVPHDDLLEMEQEDARFDDYRSLIGLVR
ncbi:hypothetical protein [Lewinella sp. W8]|uniref:PD-(D/E)XK nuclease family protein n=1 Tax=Lewinella sp. W8 TaxID=2528208 RepID=UPI001068B567|nr:hypothetical protein [Lewinella sp. W8]MTB49945.1 hypothetical protein [Lewinella sp. W8]